MEIKVFVILFIFLFLSPVNSAVSAVVCDEASYVVTTTPAPPQAAKVVSRHLKVKSSSTHKVDTVIIGDSLAEQWPDDLLKYSFGPKTIFNAGIGGDRTQSLLWRLKTGSYDVLQPTNVILIVGTNNVSGDVAPCAIVAGLSIVLDEIERRWMRPNVIVLAVFPRGHNLAFRVDEIAQVNEGYRRESGARPWVKFVDYSDAMGCSQPDGCGYFRPDNLHLSREAYRRIGSRLVGRLN